MTFHLKLKRILKNMLCPNIDFDVGDWNEFPISVVVFMIATFFGLLIMVEEHFQKRN